MREGERFGGCVVRGGWLWGSAAGEDSGWVLAMRVESCDRLKCWRVGGAAICRSGLRLVVQRVLGADGGRQSDGDRRGSGRQSVVYPAGRKQDRAVNPVSGTIAEFPIPTANSGAGEIATGPDGALWFTEGTVNQIGRITPAGQILEYPLVGTPDDSSQPGSIVSGPGGQLWFTWYQSTMGATIGSISTGGTVTEYLLAPHAPWGGEPHIAFGPDGNLWSQHLARS